MMTECKLSEDVKKELISRAGKSGLIDSWVNKRRFWRADITAYSLKR